MKAVQNGSFAVITQKCNKTANINVKKTTVYTKVTASDTSKTAKITKKWYYSAAHWHLGDVLMGNITFLWFLPAGLRVLFLLTAGIVFAHWRKNGFFAPHGRHVAPINVKVGTGERTFIGAKMWEYSPQNCQNSNFGHKFVPQGRLVCNIFTKFSAFVRVYRLLLSF